MADCTLHDKVQELVTAIEDKFTECSLGTPPLPTNQDDMCGDGEGLLAELHTIIGTLKTEHYLQGDDEDCEDITGPGTCITEENIDCWIAYVNSLECPGFVGCRIYVEDGAYTTTTHLGYFDNGAIFEPGSYTLTLEPGEIKMSFNIAGRVYTVYGLGPTGNAGNSFKVVIEVDPVGAPVIDLDIQATAFDTKAEYQAWASGYAGRTITTTSRARIGVKMIRTGNYYTSRVVDHGFILSNCPNSCTPTAPTGLSYTPSYSPVSGVFSWTNPDDCASARRIQWKRIGDLGSDCTECTTSATFLDDPDHVAVVGATDTSYSLPDASFDPVALPLSQGAYCARVDTINGGDTVLGTPICFEVPGCYYTLGPDIISTNPNTSGTLDKFGKRTVSAYVVRAFVVQIFLKKASDPAEAWRFTETLVANGPEGYQPDADWWRALDVDFEGLGFSPNQYGSEQWDLRVIAFDDCDRQDQVDKEVSIYQYNDPTTPCTPGTVEPLEHFPILNQTVLNTATYRNQGKNYTHWRIRTSKGSTYPGGGGVAWSGSVSNGILEDLEDSYTTLDYTCGTVLTLELQCKS